MPNCGICDRMASAVSALVQTKVSTASPTRYALLPFVKNARRSKTITRLLRRTDEGKEDLVDVILKAK